MLGIQAGKFPTTLYVNEPLTSGKTDKPITYDAYATWEDSEDGDVVAVYELRYVGTIKHTVTAQLCNETGAVLLEALR